jgi:hypothetical protein
LLISLCASSLPSVIAHFYVLGIDNRFVDLDRDHVARAIGHDGHFAAASRGGDLLVGEFSLRGLHLLLHLRGLLHHFFEVHSWECWESEVSSGQKPEVGATREAHQI